MPLLSGNTLILARQQAGELLHRVVQEQVDPDAALMAWPRLTDTSLQVAYQALIHFSVDVSGYHKTEPLYADVQLSWLNSMAKQLKTGQALPYSMQVGYTRTARFYWKPFGWIVLWRNTLINWLRVNQ